MIQQEVANQPQKLPKISIIIPNYNAGKTLEATLQSLIDQKYPALEIIVVDGGSSDNSVEIIQKFGAHIAWWTSSSDSGQSNAINKGFSKSSGEIVNWLCSDDVLTLGALETVAACFLKLPDIDVLVGACKSIRQDKANEVIIRKSSLKLINLMPAASGAIAQPSCFYKRSLVDRVQLLDESYHYTMDFELWNYFKSRGAKWHCIDKILSVAVQDGQNKSSTGGERVTIELERVYTSYVQEWLPLTFWHRRLRYPLERFLAMHPGRIWFYAVGPIWLVLTFILSPFYGFNRAWMMRWKRWA